MLRESTNLFELIEAATNLYHQFGTNYEVSIRDQTYTLETVIEDMYRQAGRLRLWSVLRQSAALLKKVDTHLQSSVNHLLTHQKHIQVGKSYSEESFITKPIPFSRLLQIIEHYCHDDIRDQVFTQEILVFLGILIQSRPQLFDDLQTIRISYLILLLTGVAARKENLNQEDAFDWLMQQSPSFIQSTTEHILEKYFDAGSALKNLESIKHDFGSKEFIWKIQIPVRKTPDGGWLVWRKSTGTINRESDEFYHSVWRILEHASGIIIGDKLDRRNRLTSSLILSDMTPGDKAFALRIENLLNKISAPEYRQLTVEVLKLVADFTDQNPTLEIEDNIVCDVIIGHAVRMAYLNQHPHLVEEYHDHKPDAWTHFYQLSPHDSTRFMADAYKFLLAYEPDSATLVT